MATAYRSVPIVYTGGDGHGDFTPRIQVIFRTGCTVGVDLVMIVAMVVSLRHIMFECVDPYNLAHFWSAVLGRPVDAGASSCWVKLPAGNELSSLLFVHNLSGRRGGNRLFVRISSEDGTLEEEIGRLMGLGALLVSRSDRGCGIGWAVMADPEGNEFYVDSSDVEVAKAKAELMIPLLDDR